MHESLPVLKIFHFQILKLAVNYHKDYETSGPHGPQAGCAGLFSYPEGCVLTLEIKFSAINSKFKLNAYRTNKLSRYHSGTLHGPQHTNSTKGFCMVCWHLDFALLLRHLADSLQYEVPSENQEDES